MGKMPSFKDNRDEESTLLEQLDSKTHKLQPHVQGNWNAVTVLHLRLKEPQKMSSSLSSQHVWIILASPPLHCNH